MRAKNILFTSLKRQASKIADERRAEIGALKAEAAKIREKGDYAGVKAEDRARPLDLRAKFIRENLTDLQREQRDLKPGEKGPKGNPWERDLRNKLYERRPARQ